MSIALWSINRWLRLVGVRLYVEVDMVLTNDRKPTRIGFMWVGLPGSKGWKAMQP
jgi:type IV secretory pathway VirB3-like protein